MAEGIVSLMGMAFLGVAGWVLISVSSLGSRVSVVEAQFEALKELIETKFEDLDRRLERIERGMNGHLKDID